MWVLFLVLSCSQPSPQGAPPEPVVEPAPDPAPAPVPAPDPAPPAVGEDDPCMEACMRRNMARAVAAEMIEEDCRAECTAQVVVRTKDDLDLRLGQRVTAAGTFARTLHHGHGPEPYMGLAVVLADGTPLWIADGTEPSAVWAAWLDKPVRVDGRLEQGAEGDPGIWLRDVGPPEGGGL